MTERRAEILGFIVREYIDAAAPVSSKVIAERHTLGISPATIRNEMAYLEREGYLTHPHTSAGRVPTTGAYRYFVEHLMRETTVPADERRMIEHQFHQLDMELEEWIRLAAAVLASRASTASLVTAPRARRPQLRRLALVPVGESTVLLLVVLQDGAVKRRVVHTGASRSARALGRLAEGLNAQFLDLSGEEVRAECSHLQTIEQEIGMQVAELMDDVELHGSLELYRYGLAQMLRQPEFAEAEKAEKVVGVLESPGYLENVLAEIGVSHRGVQVIIGGEGRWPEISDFSLVVARYGLAWQSPGVVGIVGPTRMSYARNIPMVSFVADLMSTLMQGWDM